MKAPIFHFPPRGRGSVWLGAALRNRRRPYLAARVAAAAILVSGACAFDGKAATLLSSFNLPTATATATGGGSFSSTPSPRGGSVPIPTGIGSGSYVSEAQQSAPAASSTSASAAAGQGGGGSHTGGGGGGEETPERSSEKSNARHTPSGHETASGGGAKGAGSAPVSPGGKPAAPGAPPEKNAPAQAIVTTAKSLWTADLGYGWYNKYYFRGVDILKEISPRTSDQGVFNAKATLAYSREVDAFSIGLGYVEALGTQTPNGAARLVTPNNTVNAGNGKFVPKKDNEQFNLPPQSRYEEYDLYLAYTRELIKGQLQGTIGYNHYQFSDGSFYGKTGDPIPFADEATLRLDYLGLPFVRPSLTLAKDFDAFYGEYLEFRIDGGYDLYKRGSFGIRVEPYVAVSYDFQYNGSDNGWNALEFGLGVPIRLNDHLTVTLTGNYTHALDESLGQPRANTGFWGGVVMNLAWGSVATPPHPPGDVKLKDAKNVISVPDPDKFWEFSAGAAYREFDYDFQPKSVSPSDPAKGYQKVFRTGDLGLATPGIGKTYDNGAVFAGSAPPVSPLTGKPVAGTANFRITGTDQVLGSLSKGTAQVRFNTTDYSYSTKGRSFATPTQDEDPVASSYLSLSKEVWRSGALSGRVGLLYAFSDTEGDSGVNLSRLDSLMQRTDVHGYVYTVDSVSSNVLPVGKPLGPGQFSAVVVNSAQYASSYAGLAVVPPSSPQTELTGVVREATKIATFVQTKFSITTHDLELPISLRYDINKRLHAEITASPMLTLVDADLRTTINRRALTDLAAPRVLPGATTAIGIQGGTKGNTGVNPPSGPFGNPGFNISVLNTGTSLDKPGSAVSAALAAAPQTTQGGGQSNIGSGKSGKNPDNPQLPGTDVGDQTLDGNSTDIRFGVSGTLSLIWDWNDEGTYYTEFWGRYHWTDSLGMSNSAGAASVKASGFEAGIGVGVRF